MPLYEYECERCGHRFESIQKFSDAPIQECPKCGGPVRKLQSAPAFQFKGSGWYVTDYARKDTKDTRDTRDTKDAKNAKDAKESKPETKTDSKTDTKSDSKSDSKGTSGTSGT
jgi:putative FmdB family regulatory protein